MLYLVDTPVVGSHVSLTALGNMWADLYVDGAPYAVARPGANLLPNSEWFHLHLQVCLPLCLALCLPHRRSCVLC